MSVLVLCLAVRGTGAPLTLVKTQFPLQMTLVCIKRELVGKKKIKSVIVAVVLETMANPAGSW